MVLSTLSFTIMNLLVKYLEGFSAFQLVFFRCLGTLFFTIPFLKYHRIPMRGNQQLWLLLRALFGMSSMAFFFMSVNYLAIGTAVSLRYLSPIFATLFAIVFLKQYIRPIQWLFILIALIGVWVVKGVGDTIHPLGILLAVLSAVFSGVVYVLIRKIGTKDHPVVIVHYFMSVATVVGGCLAFVHWDKTPSNIELLWLLSLGVFGYFGQVFMTKAFQTQDTYKVVSLKYMEVVFTMLAAMYLYHEVYPLNNLLGTVLIITGLVLTLVYKQKTPLKREDES